MQVIKFFAFLLTASCCLTLSLSASAQTDVVVEGDTEVVIVDEVNNDTPQNELMSLTEKARKTAPKGVLENLSTMLFFKHEFELLREAKKGLTARSASNSEVSNVRQNIEPGRRELGLAGIVYRGPKDWTIWFNEQRLTPTALPEEILDIKVKKDHIDVKWFDAYTNQIFPIRLRPHERFNLDSRLYLPG